MKSLTLSSLLLSAVALAALGTQPTQAAEYFCSLAAIDTDASVNFEGGKEKLADSCTLNGGKKLTLSATSPTPLSSGTSTITMTRSTFLDASMVWYFAGTEGTMSNAGPIVFRVVGNTFNRNAVLVFQGSFPKDSEIDIRGNTWVGITSPHSTYGALAAHAIFFYTDSTQRLDERAKIRITGNTIPVSVSTVGYAIGVYANLAMYANSLLEISGNELSATVTASNNYFPAVVGWSFTSSFNIQGSGSSVVISNNKINAGNNALGIYLPPFNSGINTFNLNITNNVINLNGDGHFPVRCRGLSLSGNSRATITDNTMSSNGNSDSRILLTDTSIGGTAIVQVSNNKLSAFGGNAVISFEKTAQVAGSAQLYVEFNKIERTDDFNAGVPGIQFINAFTMSGSSLTSISYNNFNAKGTPHYMIYSGEQTTKNAPAKFFLCNNVHYGSVLTSYSSYFSTSVFNAMENQTLCLARTTAAPTTTTTTRASTTTTTTTTATPLPSGETTTRGVINVSTNSGNETSIENGTLIETDVNATTAETTLPSPTTFAPGVNTTSPPLNNQSGGRSGVALLCASVLGALISAFV